MTTREALMTVLLIVAAFILGWMAKPQKGGEPTIIEHCDTTWLTIHDTTYIALERTVERLDTVLLASVDTLRDSVLVEVPIERQVWSGENYAITTSGYRVQLQSVDIHVPTIEHTVTKTVTKVKHWNCGVGLQAGYGITIHGGSPYAGVGFTAGYNF